MWLLLLGSLMEHVAWMTQRRRKKTKKWTLLDFQTSMKRSRDRNQIWSGCAMRFSNAVDCRARRIDEPENSPTEKKLYQRCDWCAGIVWKIKNSKQQPRTVALSVLLLVFGALELRRSQLRWWPCTIATKLSLIIWKQPRRSVGPAITRSLSGVFSS